MLPHTPPSSAAPRTPLIPHNPPSSTAPLHRSDPAERLALDHRLVVAFPPEGAVIADLGLRHHNIAAWYRGMGQINRIQGVWEPDWVGIDFLVYRSGPAGFSVLWDEQGEVIRHIIDFNKLALDE